MKVRTKALVAIFLLFGSAYLYDSVPSVFPVFAWRYGTLKHQIRTVEKFRKRFPPGTPIEEVAKVLGPRSPGWPEDISQLDLDGTGRLEFGVRARVNYGVLFYYEKGVVTRSIIYD